MSLLFKLEIFSNFRVGKKFCVGMKYYLTDFERNGNKNLKFK